MLYYNLKSLQKIAGNNRTITFSERGRVLWRVHNYFIKVETAFMVTTTEFYSDYQIKIFRVACI
jgi:hypothetical protein